jgi:RND superfamily putative drug exporter
VTLPPTGLRQAENVCYNVPVTERLARAAAAHPWRTIGAWIAAIVIALGFVATLLGGNLTSEGAVTNNPESVRAEQVEE